MASTAATVGFGPDSSSWQKASLMLLSMPPPPDFCRHEGAHHETCSWSPLLCQQPFSDQTIALIRVS